MELLQDITPGRLSGDIRKRQVCYVHLAASPGGIEVLVPQIAGAMAAHDPSVFIVREPPGSVNVYDNTNLPVQYGSRNNIAAIIRLFHFGRHHRQAIFQVYNIGPLFLLVLRMAGVKRIIYNIHGSIYWRSQPKKYLLKCLWRIALNKGILMVANSEYSRNRFMKAVSRRYPVRVIYNPMNLDRFVYGKERKTYDRIKIVYCGRLEPGKGLSEWIRLAAQVHRKMPGTYFEIYGSGSLQSPLQNLITREGADDYIFLKGYHPSIQEVYGTADIMLFLSEYESFGNAVVESILCGTPVLAAGLPSMKEIFINYPEFILDDHSDYSTQVLAAIWNLEKMNSLAESAAREFRLRFSMQAHLQELRKLYQHFA